MWHHHSFKYGVLTLLRPLELARWRRQEKSIHMDGPCWIHGRTIKLKLRLFQTLEYSSLSRTWTCYKLDEYCQYFSLFSTCYRHPKNFMVSGWSLYRTFANYHVFVSFMHFGAQAAFFKIALDHQFWHNAVWREQTPSCDPASLLCWPGRRWLAVLISSM